MERERWREEIWERGGTGGEGGGDDIDRRFQAFLLLRRGTLTVEERSEYVEARFKLWTLNVE